VTLITDPDRDTIDRVLTAIIILLHRNGGRMTFSRKAFDRYIQKGKPVQIRAEYDPAQDAMVITLLKVPE
jgi:hypothetical protein